MIKIYAALKTAIYITAIIITILAFWIIDFKYPKDIIDDLTNLD